MQGLFISCYLKIILANQDRLYKNHYNFLHLLSSIFQISVIPNPLTALVPEESQESFPFSKGTIPAKIGSKQL